MVRRKGDTDRKKKCVEHGAETVACRGDKMEAANACSDARSCLSPDLKLKSLLQSGGWSMSFL
eukprot:760065-Hanusia_phi.AAC.2